MGGLRVGEGPVWWLTGGMRVWWWQVNIRLKEELIRSLAHSEKEAEQLVRRRRRRRRSTPVPKRACLQLASRCSPVARSCLVSAESRAWL